MFYVTVVNKRASTTKLYSGNTAYFFPTAKFSRLIKFEKVKWGNKCNCWKERYLLQAVVYFTKTFYWYLPGIFIKPLRIAGLRVENLTWNLTNRRTWSYDTVQWIEVLLWHCSLQRCPVLRPSYEEKCWVWPLFAYKDKPNSTYVQHGYMGVDVDRSSFRPLVVDWRGLQRPIIPNKEGHKAS
jgi:hypothetical protein